MPEIRPKIRIQHVQKAQGMVEFALVLPLLLLLILGVFAFGHLFFVYTSVVSASREAARWGAAVGEAPSSFPRYVDCPSIRAQAVRLGAFAGVNATDISDIASADPKDPGVDIKYDHGPNPDGSSTPYADCPAAAPSTGPTDVAMGDRIIVTVLVDYTPIVPVVNLPSFPLKATTYRTILKSVPVGEAPTAVDPCLTDTTITVTADNEPSVVGQPVSFSLAVTAVDKNYKDPIEGDVTLTGDAADSADGQPFSCSGTMLNGTFTCPNTIAYPAVGIKKLQAAFHTNDQSNACLTDSQGAYDHTVIPADTNIQLTASSPQQVGVSLTVTAIVQSVFPGAGIPTGVVVFTWEDPNDPRSNGVALVNGGGSWIFAPQHPGVYVLRADYPDPADRHPDPNYNASTASIYVTVLAPTETPGGEATPGPSPTPPPPYCPTAPGGLAFSNSGNTIMVNVSNNQGAAQAVQLTAVDLSWSRIPNSPITNITFVGNGLWPVMSGNQAPPLLAPPHQTVGKGTQGWAGPSLSLPVNGSGQLVITLGGALPSGSTNKYMLGLTFSSTDKKGNPDCVLTIEGYNY